jgi:iron complex outermembrane receptor protein
MEIGECGMERTDLVAQAVRLALAAGMAGVISISPTYAQDETDELAVQEKITVTGSRIKRADYEGPLPVTVITREEIDASGEISVAEVLRTQTFNSFGSDKQQSGSSSGSVNTISMRGLGPWYTLVLVNGRRMASAPTYATSVQNLSMIPMAAVERIEVLRDGASAIYGTDAMAGVINIILRRDYSGINLSYYIGRPTQSGGDEDSYSITGGISGAKGNVTFGMDVQKQDIVFSRDRDFTFGDNTSIFGFPSSYFAYLETDDPRNPAGHFLSVSTFPDPRCPSEIGTDPDFPWSEKGPTSWGGEACRYAYAGASAREAENDTKSFFVDANYDINDRTSFFARGIFSYNEVFGRYAPSPILPPLFMSQDYPQNPTNPDNPTNYRGDAFAGQSIDVDTDGDGVPDTTVEGPFDVSVYYRNVPGGDRDTNFDDTLLDYVAGLRGTVDWLGGTDWEVAAQWSEQTSDERSSGQAMIPALQSEIDSGAFDIFGVFGPYGDDDRAVAQRATATATSSARHRITGGDGQLTFDAFQLENGAVPVAIGFEYRDEDFDLEIDEQTAAGAIGGGGGQIQGYSGARVVKSIFSEGVIPVLGNLEVNLAGRYDDYNDFGTTFNPKVSVAYRPLDTMLLRASYGTGFMAPDMSLLYYPVVVTAGHFIDSWQCSQSDLDADGDGRPDVPQDEVPQWHPCKHKYHDGQVRHGGNPDLQPEESDNWTAGWVWSPTSDLSVVLDYYNIEIKEQIWNEDMQRLMDDELRLRQGGEEGGTVGRVTRHQSGRINYLFWTLENIDVVETDGIDAEARYSFSVGKIGDFSTTLRWTRVLSYEKDFNDGNGSQDWVGEVGFPEDRGQLTINWSMGDYTATVVGNYIADQNGTGPWNNDEDEHLASFTTWDVQASYSTPWNGQITFGARNVFDRDPPQYLDGTDYDNGQHEVYGRVPYLRLEQDF